MEKVAKKRRKFIKTLVLVVVSLPLLGKYLIPRLKQQKLLLRVKKKDIPGGGAPICPLGNIICRWSRNRKPQ